MDEPQDSDQTLDAPLVPADSLDAGLAVGFGRPADAPRSVLSELRPVLGIHPQVSFSGPVDKMVTGALAEEVLAVLRETLTNVGKHAHANQVVVTVTAGDQLRLVVADDGKGIGEISPGGLGLKNLRQRAERRGGGMEIGTSREGGTRLSWYVPLDDVEEGFGAIAPA